MKELNSTRLSAIKSCVRNILQDLFLHFCQLNSIRSCWRKWYMLDFCWFWAKCQWQRICKDWNEIAAKIDLIDHIPMLILLSITNQCCGKSIHPCCGFIFVPENVKKKSPCMWDLSLGSRKIILTGNVSENTTGGSREGTQTMRTITTRQSPTPPR